MGSSQVQLEAPFLDLQFHAGCINITSAVSDLLLRIGAGLYFNCPSFSSNGEPKSGKVKTVAAAVTCCSGSEIVGSNGRAHDPLRSSVPDFAFSVYVKFSSSVPR